VISSWTIKPIIQDTRNHEPKKLDGDSETLLDNRRWVEGDEKGWLVLEDSQFGQITKKGQLVASTERKRVLI
jgi:hypothetical protein